MKTIPAEAAHVPGLLARMADDQRERFLVMHGADAGEQIVGNIDRSSMTWCGIDDVGVVNLGGVYPIDPKGTGYVWQFITPAIRLHKRAYLEQGRVLIQASARIFTRLVAPIEAEYHAAARHARRFGMTTDHVQTIAGLPVCFCMKAHS